MARGRDPLRIDEIASAAAEAFIEFGYFRAKVHQIADRAKVGPGTVYLYAQDKESLFELALLRALESPLAANPILPYRRTHPRARRQLIEDCLREVAQFPQLWVAGQRRNISESLEEYHGILLELCAWMRRYRSLILLTERNRVDWPDLAELFQHVIWSDLHHRLTAYLATRMRTGHLVAVGDPAAVARHTLDALVATLVLGPLAPKIGTQEDELVVRLVSAAVVGGGSGNHLPLPPHPGEHPAV